MRLLTNLLCFKFGKPNAIMEGESLNERKNSADLAPLEYWLFSDMQSYSERKDFSKVDDVEETLMDYFGLRLTEERNPQVI
uniref:DUF4038 domain-containing protein n=1 Tax=Caenorhabditis tropicalis TaxID=1561998 RepID=A0A1I7U1M9_9PELO